MPKKNNSRTKEIVLEELRKLLLEQGPPSEWQRWLKIDPSPPTPPDWKIWTDDDLPVPESYEPEEPSITEPKKEDVIFYPKEEEVQASLPDREEEIAQVSVIDPEKNNIKPSLLRVKPEVLDSREVPEEFSDSAVLSSEYQKWMDGNTRFGRLMKKENFRKKEKDQYETLGRYGLPGYTQFKFERSYAPKYDGREFGARERCFSTGEAAVRIANQDVLYDIARYTRNKISHNKKGEILGKGVIMRGVHEEWWDELEKRNSYANDMAANISVYYNGAGERLPSNQRANTILEDTARMVLKYDILEIAPDIGIFNHPRGNEADTLSHARSFKTGESELLSRQRQSAGVSFAKKLLRSGWPALTPPELPLFASQKARADVDISAMLEAFSQRERMKWKKHLAAGSDAPEINLRTKKREWLEQFAKLFLGPNIDKTLSKETKLPNSGPDIPFFVMPHHVVRSDGESTSRDRSRRGGGNIVWDHPLTKPVSKNDAYNIRGRHYNAYKWKKEDFALAKIEKVRDVYKRWKAELESRYENIKRVSTTINFSEKGSIKIHNEIMKWGATLLKSEKTIGPYLGRSSKKERLLLQLRKDDSLKTRLSFSSEEEKDDLLDNQEWERSNYLQGGEQVWPASEFVHRHAQSEVSEYRQIYIDKIVLKNQEKGMWIPEEYFPLITDAEYVKLISACVLYIQLAYIIDRLDENAEKIRDLRGEYSECLDMYRSGPVMSQGTKTAGEMKKPACWKVHTGTKIIKLCGQGMPTRPLLGHRRVVRLRARDAENWWDEDAIRWYVRGGPIWPGTKKFNKGVKDNINKWIALMIPYLSEDEEALKDFSYVLGTIAFYIGFGKAIGAAFGLIAKTVKWIGVRAFKVLVKRFGGAEKFGKRLAEMFAKEPKLKQLLREYEKCLQKRGATGCFRKESEAIEEIMRLLGQSQPARKVYKKGDPRHPRWTQDLKSAKKQLQQRDAKKGRLSVPEDPGPGIPQSPGGGVPTLPNLEPKK